MTARTRSSRRPYNAVDVCLHCGSTATANAVADCTHTRTARVELTPQIARLLTQLRGARSFVRYVAERFHETVEVAQLAGRATIREGRAEEEPATVPPRESEPKRLRRPLANVVAAAEEPPPVRDERQVELFGASRPS
jgi:hypothetical protein